MITLRGLPLRRPVVVRRKAPHFPGRGGHSPLRLPVARTIHRCTCQKDTTTHRGGSRALAPAIPNISSRGGSHHSSLRTWRTAECGGAESGGAGLARRTSAKQRGLHRSPSDQAEEPREEAEGYGTRRGLVHGAGEEQVELRTPEQPGARRSGVTDQLGTSPPSIRMAKSTSSA